MNKFFMAVGVGLLSVSALANTPTFKTLPDEKATFELCKQAATTFNTSDLDFKPVISVFEPYWRFGRQSLEKAEQSSISLTVVGLPIWGDTLNEVIHVDSNKAAKDYFLRHRFLLRRENTGLLFQCIFYKANQNWQLHTFIWSDEPMLFFIQPNLNPTH